MIDSLHALMAEVGSETLAPEEDELESNPVKVWAEKLYEALQTATDRVIERGREALNEAIESVLQVWNGMLDEVTAIKSEIQDLFCHQVRKLIHGGIKIVTSTIPFELGEPWNGKLTSLKFTISTQISPGIKAAATEWLEFVATGQSGIEVEYRACE